MRLVVACVCIACGSVAAAPKSETARDKYKAAAALAADDDNEAALKLVDEGLALAPKNLELLQLRANLLLKTRDYDGALAAYQAYLDVGAVGANRREAIKILDSLRPVKTTFVDLTANTAATIYLDTRSAGVFCTAPCKKAVLPGDYKVIAEKPGFDRWIGRLTVESGKTAPLAIALVEKPSPLTVKVAPDGVVVAIDGQPLDLGARTHTVPAGAHEVVVRLAGHATRKLPLAAHEGNPVAIDVTLDPLIPLALTPPTATVTLDDKPAIREDGGVVVPAGAHVLAAKAPGHRDLRIDIPEQRDADFKLTIALAPLVDVTVKAPPPAPPHRTPDPELVAVRLTGGMSWFGAGDLVIAPQPTLAIVASHPLRVGPMTLELGARMAYTPLPYDVMGDQAVLGRQRDASVVGGWAAAAVLRPIGAHLVLRGELGAGVVHLGGLVDGNPITTSHRADTFTLPSLRFAAGADYLLTRNWLATVSPFGLVFSPGIDGMTISALREIAIVAGIGYRQ